MRIALIFNHNWYNNEFQVTVQEIHELVSNQEETNTRVVLYLSYTVRLGYQSAVLRTPDNDMFFILLNYAHSIPLITTLFIQGPTHVQLNTEVCSYLIWTNDLKNVSWSTAYIYDDVDNLWHHWAILYNDVLDKHAPIKKKRVRGDQLPWITLQIQRAISRRNRYFKKHVKNPTKTSWEEFKK